MADKKPNSLLVSISRAPSASDSCPVSEVVIWVQSQDKATISPNLSQQGGEKRGKEFESNKNAFSLPPYTEAPIAITSPLKTNTSGTDKQETFVQETFVDVNTTDIQGDIPSPGSPIPLRNRDLSALLVGETRYKIVSDAKQLVIDFKCEKETNNNTTTITIGDIADDKEQFNRIPDSHLAVAARLYLLSHIRNLRAWVQSTNYPTEDDQSSEGDKPLIDWLVQCSTSLQHHYKYGLLRCILMSNALWLAYLVILLKWPTERSFLVNGLIPAMLDWEFLTLNIKWSDGPAYFAWLPIGLAWVAALRMNKDPHDKPPPDDGISAEEYIRTSDSFGVRTIAAGAPLLQAIAAGTPGLTIVWLLWPAFFPSQATPRSLDLILGLSLLLCSVLLLLAVGAPLKQSDRRKLQKYRDRQETLDEALLSLAHVNTMVALGCFQGSQKNIIHASSPESFLRTLDEALSIKSSVISFESVIRANLRYERQKISDIVERKARGQRAALSAASGMAAGFVTFSIGESVMQYLDMPTQNDADTHKFFQTVKLSPRLNTTLSEDSSTTPALNKTLPHKPSTPTESVALTHGAPCDIQTKLPLPTGWNNTFANTTQCSLLKEVTRYQEEAHQDMLEDYSLLLVITLISALIAAWAAVKREQPVE